MGTQFNDGTSTNYDADGVRAFQSPPIVTAVEGISAAVLARVKTSAVDTSTTLGGGSASDAKIPTQLAVKTYVDGAITGGATEWKESATCATTAALPACTYNNGAGTLTGNSNGALSAQDGVTPTANMRILVKNQASTFQNGPYTVTTVGDGSNPFVLTRATDADTAAELSNATILVLSGSTLGGTSWFVNTTVTTLGTDPVPWVQTTAAASVADGSITSAKIADATIATGDLADDAVTFAKMQNVTTDRLLGRDTASTGNVEELTLGSGLEFTGSAGIQTTLGARLKPGDVGVCQLSGSTYAFDSTGVISSAATSAANNVTVIQAAIDAIAGTYTNGHGGGGAVVFDGSEYSISAYIDVKPGVSLLGNGSFDRNGVATGGSPSAHAFYGTTFTPTSGLSTSVDIRPDGTTVSKAPVILMGRVRYTSTTTTNSATSTSLPVADRTYFPQSGNFTIDIGGTGRTVSGGHGTGAGTFTLTSSATWTSGATVELTQQSETNPHGVRIQGINIDCRNKPTAQALLIVDSQFVYVNNCNIANAYSSGGRGIEVYSSLSPDEGGHGTRITDCMIANCYEGIYGSGAGSTDSFVTGCRVLQCVSKGLYLGAGGGGGGWQISDNHFTTASGTSCDHMHVDTPATIVNNYLDTCGGYHVILSGPSVVMGNIIKGNNGNADNVVAPIDMGSSGGRMSVVANNVAQLEDTAYVALVRISSTTGDTYRPVITGNMLLTGGSGVSFVGAACTSAGAAIAESSAAMLTSTTGTNPFIFGNRIAANAGF